MDFESPDDIETRFRRQTPMKTYSNVQRQEEPVEYAPPVEPQKVVEEAGTASSESDYYENNADQGERYMLY